MRQSDMATYAGCRRRWWWKCVEKWEPVYPPGSYPKPTNGNLGTLVHKLIEIYYGGEPIVEDILESVMTKEQMMAARMDQAWVDHVKWAQILAQSYFDWIENEGIDLGLEIKGTEIELDVNDIQMHLDIVFGAPNLGTLIRDFKTVDTLSRNPAHNDFQLLTYAWGWWRDTGEVPHSVGHRAIVRNKRTARSTPPFEDDKPIRVTEVTLRNHEDRLRTQYNEMERHAHIGEVEDPVLWPNPTRDCSWRCIYKDVCPMVERGEDFRYVLSSEFQQKESD